MNRGNEGRGGRAVLDIPHMAVLSCETAKALQTQFEDLWDQTPEAVVLPLLCPEGVPFPVTSLGIRMFRVNDAETQGQIGLGDACQRFSKLGKRIYLSVVPSLSFIGNDLLHVVDIVGDSARQGCFGRQGTQRLLQRLIREGAEIVRQEGDLAGVVLDVVNLWPMSASDGRLELTCFCDSCRKYFEEKLGRESARDLVRTFELTPNPWNLLLQDSDTGIGHVNEMDSSVGAAEILHLSRRRGYIKAVEEMGDAKLRELAELLVQYLYWRRKQTEEAIQEIFNELPAGVARVVLTEGLRYNWTSGLFFDALDDEDLCSELWLNPSDSELVTKNVPFRAYMWRRSRYIIDHFFDLRASAADPDVLATTGVRRLGRGGLSLLLSARARETLGTRMGGKLDIELLPDLADRDAGAGRIGFVGVALSAPIMRRLVDSVRFADMSPLEEEIKGRRSKQGKAPA